LSSFFISFLAALHQVVQNLALMIDGTPEPIAPPADNEDHLIKVPAIAGPWSGAVQVGSDR